MIDVVVIGGYLGSGKTSLVNHLLRTGTGRSTLVLVNDFGAVAVEPELVAASDGEVMTLANGCMCCSLSSPLIEMLVELRERADRPELLVIETSGVADPEPVAHHAMIPGFRLAAIVVVADAETVRARSQHALVGRTVRRQLEAAGLVVLNKVDLVPPVELDRLHRWLTDAAPSAVVVDAHHGVVPVDLLVGPDVSSATPPVQDHERPHDGHDGHDGHADHDDHDDHAGTDPHRTITWTSPGPVDRDGLMAVLDDVDAGIVRAKGVVTFNDRPDRAEMVQVVGRRVHLTALPDRPRDTDAASRLVLIGLPPHFDPAALQARLDETLAG